MKSSELRIGAHGDHADSSVQKWKSFINTTYYQTLTLFAFHTNKKQYLDTLHIIQKKREMHRRVHNNDFDILIRSVY